MRRIKSNYITALVLIGLINWVGFEAAICNAKETKENSIVQFAKLVSGEIRIVRGDTTGLETLLLEYRTQLIELDPNWAITAQIKDLDLDGNEEVLFESFSGGSCCPPLVGIAFFNKSTDKIETFEFDKWTTWNGWDDVHIKIDNGRSELSGIMNTYHPETQEQHKTLCVTYIFSGERPRIKQFLVPDNQDKAGSGGLFACDDPVLWK